MPKRLVVVNVAAFEIYYFENDAIVWQNRAQVGREVSQTPQYRDDTQYLVLNPYVLRQDPGPNNALGAVKTIYLDDPVPVMLLYWTVTVAKGGPVEFIPDIYKRDSAVLRALKQSTKLRREKRRADQQVVQARDD